MILENARIKKSYIVITKDRSLAETLGSGILHENTSKEF